MTQDKNNDQYLGVFLSVAECLDDSVAALEQVCRDAALDEDDLDALDWMSTSLIDLAATIKGLMLADGYRSSARMNV